MRFGLCMRGKQGNSIHNNETYTKCEKGTMESVLLYSFNGFMTLKELAHHLSLSLFHIDSLINTLLGYVTYCYINIIVQQDTFNDSEPVYILQLNKITYNDLP